MSPFRAVRRARVQAVLPAYNAARTLEGTLDEIPRGSVDDVLVVDDGSTDATVDVAKSLGLEVIVHPENRGYGGNQKTCYTRALEGDADIVVLLHPDGQYDARTIPVATQLVERGICDCVLGSRIRTRREALEGGMPVYKYIGNRVLTFMENVVLGQNLGDFHSGFRVYSREVLETLPWQHNSDDFVFDSQFLAQVVHFGFKLGDVPVPVRYFEEASSIGFLRGASYSLATLGVLGELWLHRLRLLRSKRFSEGA